MLHQVITSSRQGTGLVLDQCAACGGIWFDKYELFSLDEEKARQIDTIDLGRLRYPKGAHESCSCPRCNIELEEFRDPNIPKNVQLLYCGKCGGFWVNHGELTEYAQFRAAQGHKTPDPKLAEEYEKMLMSQSKKSYWQGMEEFGRAAGGPRDFITGLPLDGTASELARIDRAQDAFFTVIGIAVRLLFGWL